MFTGCYQTAPADQFRPEPVRGDQINPGPPMSSGLINFYYTKHLMIIFIKDWVKLAEPTGKTLIDWLSHVSLPWITLTSYKRC